MSTEKQYQFRSDSACVEVGMDELGKARSGLVKLFLPTVFYPKAHAFESLSQAYAFFTGDPEISGRFYPERIMPGLRACMEFNSGSFVNALQNALNMMLSKAYKEFPYHEDILISQKNTVKDFRTIRSVQLGNFEDLAELDPEAKDYDDVAPIGDTAAEYNLRQTGALIWITRTTIINDNIGWVKAVIRGLAKAARRTHARYAWNFFINNALCPDGTAWFTSEHGNLGSLALDFAPLVAAITAMANMTEPGPSTEVIGLDLPSFNWNLVVPTNMWDLAVKKNQGQYEFTSNDLTTGVPVATHRLFGDHNERIITCPLLPNDNDWGIIRDKQDVPIVEMSYLNGHEEPDFIIQQGATAERAMRSDRVGYKIRHEYGGSLVDHRGGYKSIVV
jgi:hypothetical protein